MKERPKILVIQPGDDVGVALMPLPAGWEGEGVRLTQEIPAGHKFSLREIPAGSPVRKYGASIGLARADIAPGEWVHTHNLQTGLSGQLKYEYHPARPAPVPAAAEGAFLGYPRADGQVGIRNELWILPTVGCVAATAEALARRATLAFADQVPDGVIAFSHPYGCSQLGDDHEATQRLLAALARHPNAGGVLVLGLGCENNHMESFRQVLGEVDPDRVKFLVAQEVPDEQEAALSLMGEIAAVMALDRREEVSAGRLVVGLKCGGSDGFSGITANPLLGAFSDGLIARGGGTVLTEVPEMFGAEQLLMDRAANRQVFDQTVSLINDFKAYFEDHGQPVYENPSPGNKAGGISTLEDKSLGCTQKGGTSPVVDVIPYAGRRVRRPGLTLLEGPGNDLVAVTALAAAGCHLVLFTTGRGTPLGGPAPVLKVASNSELARRKPGWIDFDAGALLCGDSMESLAGDLTALVLETASGRPTASERNGHREMAIWKRGVTL